MTPELYEACKQAAHVIAVEGEIIKAGRAGMFLLEELGYPKWLVRPFTWPPLVWLTELGYWLIANNRMFFSRFMFTKEE